MGRPGGGWCSALGRGAHGGLAQPSAGPGAGRERGARGTSSLGGGGLQHSTERSTLFTTARMHIQYIHIYRKPSDRRGGGTPRLGPWGRGRKCVYTEAFPLTRMPEVPTRTRGHAYVGQGGLKDAVSMHRRPGTRGLREGKDPETGPGQCAQWLVLIPGHRVAGLIPSLWSGCLREATARCLSPPPS